MSTHVCLTIAYKALYFYSTCIHIYVVRFLVVHSEHTLNFDCLRFLDSILICTIVHTKIALNYTCTCGPFKFQAFKELVSTRVCLTIAYKALYFCSTCIHIYVVRFLVVHSEHTLNFDCLRSLDSILICTIVHTKIALNYTCTCGPFKFQAFKELVSTHFA